MTGQEETATHDIAEGISKVVLKGGRSERDDLSAELGRMEGPMRPCMDRYPRPRGQHTPSPVAGLGEVSWDKT